MTFRQLHSWKQQLLPSGVCLAKPLLELVFSGTLPKKLDKI
jgi:hypothetical protein